MLNWTEAKEMSWKDRNALVQAEVRIFLNTRPASQDKLTTAELAKAVADDSDRTLSHLLARLAPYLAPYATHDGPSFVRYGRTMRRWYWKGQAHG